MSAAVQDVALVGFPDAVFDVFSIPDFDGRMTRLRAVVTPRLREIGALLAPTLSDVVGEPLFPHVALHLRRRVNPPTDTWVAFGPSARGYKALPHLEVGVDARGVFTHFMLKPEGQDLKAPFLKAQSLPTLKARAEKAPLIWYTGDHGEGPVPVADIKPRAWSDLKAHALRKDKSLCIGLMLDRTDPAVTGPALMLALLEQLQILAPFYRTARRL